MEKDPEKSKQLASHQLTSHHIALLCYRLCHTLFIYLLIFSRSLSFSLAVFFLGVGRCSLFRGLHSISSIFLFCSWFLHLWTSVDTRFIYAIAIRWWQKSAHDGHSVDILFVCVHSQCEYQQASKWKKTAHSKRNLVLVRLALNT